MQCGGTLCGVVLRGVARCGRSLVQYGFDVVLRDVVALCGVAFCVAWRSLLRGVAWGGVGCCSVAWRGMAWGVVALCGVGCGVVLYHLSYMHSPCRAAMLA